MNLTAKSRYAMKIMIDLAAHQEMAVRQRLAIAAEHGVPPDFMDHILARLRDAGLVTSIRGRLGGYRLARPAAEISAFDVLSAAEGGLEPVRCLNEIETCDNCRACNSKMAWEKVFSSVKQTLRAQTLDMLMDDRPKATVLSERNKFARVVECRSPSRAIGGEGA